MDEKELIKYAASVEAHSEHPIAKSIVNSSETYPVEEFMAIPGKGAEGKGKRQGSKGCKPRLSERE